MQRAWCLAVGLLVMPATPSTWGAEQYFDNNGSEAGLGHNGGTLNWNTTDAVWSPPDDSSGTGAGTPWTAGNIAVFAGTPGTIVPVGVVDVGGFTFNVSGYVLANGTSQVTNNYRLANGSTIHVASGVTATIIGRLQGSNISVTKSGGGKLVFSSTPSNTFTGTFTIEDGEVNQDKNSDMAIFAGGTVNVGDDIGAANSARFTTTGSGLDDNRHGIADTVAFDVKRDGLIDFHRRGETIGAITVRGNAAQAGTVTSTHNPSDHVTASSNNNTGSIAITGALTFVGGGTVNIGFVSGQKPIQDDAALVLRNDTSDITYTALAGNDGATGVLSGGLRLWSTFATTGPRTINVGDDTGLDVDLRISALVVDGDLSVSRSVLKTGAGTLELTAANTFTAPVTVNAGRLLLNNTTGSAVGSAEVTVADGGTVGGHGSMSGNLTIQSGGTLSPGVTTGSLAVGGDLTVEAVSTVAVQLAGTSFTLNATEEYDRLKVTGLTTLAGALAVDISGLTLVEGQVFGILDAVGGRTGVFNNYGEDAVVATAGQLQLKITYLGNVQDDSVSRFGGNDVVLYTAVPEAGALALLGLPLLILKRRPRRA